MSYTIAAVIVTYNRKELLLKNILSCQEQKRLLDKIIIIDNHSTDGTRDYIFKEIDKSYYDKIDYVFLDENVGGSGGFSFGVKYAYEKGYDFIWLMDDDGRPWDENTLQNLELYIKNNYLYNTPVMINSLVQCDEENLSFSESQDGKIIYHKNQIKYDELKGHCSLFNGTLISKELVKKIGIPRDDYFIKGDEKEYFARTLKNGIFTTTVVNSLYYHPSPFKWDESITIFGKTIFNNIEPGWKEYYNMRNVCLNNKLYKKNSSIVNFKNYIKRCLKILVYGENKAYLLRMITIAYNHSKKGYTGKYFLPNGQVNPDWVYQTI